MYAKLKMMLQKNDVTIRSDDVTPELLKKLKMGGTYLLLPSVHHPLILPPLHSQWHN